jgi:hypothetical protein
MLRVQQAYRLPCLGGRFCFLLLIPLKSPSLPFLISSLLRVNTEPPFLILPTTPEIPLAFFLRASSTPVCSRLAFLVRAYFPLPAAITTPFSLASESAIFALFNLAV